jgi:uncharacterized protein (DUF2235 family)
LVGVCAMPKRIVICCDGTWNKLNQKKPTNVVKLWRAVAPTDGTGCDQLTFYHPGVGTKRRERILGGLFGFGLSRNVRDAYRYVVEHYEPGDELFFFGFSRGAYTARSTVGFIRNCGILRTEHADRVDEAYEYYRDRKPGTRPDDEDAARFRREYAYEDQTPIRFIGVWDTVGALGIPLNGVPLVGLVNRRWRFHDTKLSGTVAAAYQALAIDEKRGPFRPAIWSPPADGSTQQREQVWFAGCHSDVGGGSPNPALSDISLHWMAERARACGLALEPEAFAELDEEAAFRDICESRKSFYRLLSPFVRTLGETDHRYEDLDPLALARHTERAGYAPENLLAYLAGIQKRKTEEHL